MEGFALPLLQKEFRDISQSEDTGFSVGLENDDWFKWRVCFQGPMDTPHEGGVYVALLKFPEDYPNSPPEMQFLTEMWHPNSIAKQSF
jgi:ubiquitin-conjugating enzyme E2 G1